MSFEPLMQNRTKEVAHLIEPSVSVSEIRNEDRKFLDLIAAHLYQPENPAEIEESLLDFEVDELLNALENWKL